MQAMDTDRQSASLSGLYGGTYSSISIRRQSLGHTLAVDRHQHHAKKNKIKQNKWGMRGRNLLIFGLMQMFSRCELAVCVLPFALTTKITFLQVANPMSTGLAL